MIIAEYCVGGEEIWSRKVKDEGKSKAFIVAMQAMQPLWSTCA